jgi:hypothetical protein
MTHTREEIAAHVKKHSLLWDGVTGRCCVGWHGDLYDAESRDALIEVICKKEKVA